MDLLIIVILIVATIIIKRDIKFVIYLIGIIEILLQLIHFIGDNLPKIGINSLINRYIPSSIFNIINNYTTGIIYYLIFWTLIIVFCMFLGYLIKYFIKKKK